MNTQLIILNWISLILNNDLAIELKGAGATVQAVNSAAFFLLCYGAGERRKKFLNSNCCDIHKDGFPRLFVLNIKLICMKVV